MKPEEVIELLNLQREDCTKSVLREDDIDYAIEAIEKQVPKKVDGEYDEKTCTVCDEDILSYYANYCENCGQKLDWGNED